MGWSECKRYGVIEISPINNLVKLYHSQFSYEMLGGIPGVFVESAEWQGDGLIIRGRSPHGDRRLIRATGFFSFQLL
jgi:hypothetical protein